MPSMLPWDMKFEETVTSDRVALNTATCLTEVKAWTTITVNKPTEITF